MVSPGTQPFLIIRGGDLHGVVIPIRSPVTAVGRHRNADVVIDDPTMSRRHFGIVRHDNAYHLRDLGSKNGTFVNNRNIGKEEYRLQDGDEIRFGPGPVTLIFRGASEVPASEFGVTESIWLRHESGDLGILE